MYEVLYQKNCCSPIFSPLLFGKYSSGCTECFFSDCSDPLQTTARFGGPQIILVPRASFLLVTCSSKRGASYRTTWININRININLNDYYNPVMDYYNDK